MLHVLSEWRALRAVKVLSVIKARFSCILVNFTCRFEDSPSVPERSYKQSVDILGYYYASISHVSTKLSP